MINDLLFNLDLSRFHATPLSGNHIYFITNKLNEVIYIGQTCSPAFRLDAHKSNNEFDSVKLVPLADGVSLIDAEFMVILRYKPVHNREFSTPSFNLISLRTYRRWEKDSHVMNARLIGKINDLESK